jgi:hypothetical protein
MDQRRAMEDVVRSQGINMALLKECDVWGGSRAINMSPLRGLREGQAEGGHFVVIAN